MPEIIDSQTRIAKLRALGLLEKFPDLVALDDAERAADAEIAALETARAAEREAKRRAETPIDVELPAVPEAATDTAIIRFGGRPNLRFVTVDGQTYAPQLIKRGPICFLPQRFAASLDMSQSLGGWTWVAAARIVELDELLGPADFRSVIANATSEQTAVLLAIWRRLSGRSGTLATGQASLLNSKLSQLSHSTSGPILGTARGEHDAVSRDADRILSLAGTVANASADIDRDTEQRRLTGEQLNATNDRLSAKADRDAARSAFNERIENAKFEAAIQAELAEHQAGKAAATGAP